MGKRKSRAKPPPKKRMDKLDTVFLCPFCSHGSVPDETQKQPKTGEHIDGGRIVVSPVIPPHASATVESTLIPSNTTETRTATAVVNSNPSDAATFPIWSNISVQQG